MLCLVTILILVDGFLQYIHPTMEGCTYHVTILILVDGFLQYQNFKTKDSYSQSHNPYFSRWFSAMWLNYFFVLDMTVTILILVGGFLQYAFSTRMMVGDGGHNPYFSRWFSAIMQREKSFIIH